jgi:hypothetical protein
MPRALSVSGEHYEYLAFAFDNEAAWNSNARRAVLELSLSSGGEERRAAFDMVHRWLDYHRERRNDMPEPTGASPIAAGPEYELPAEDADPHESSP